MIDVTLSFEDPFFSSTLIMKILYDLFYLFTLCKSIQNNFFPFLKSNIFLSTLLYIYIFYLTNQIKIKMNFFIIIYGKALEYNNITMSFIHQ